MTIKEMYEEIERNTITTMDNRIYEKLGDGMNKYKSAFAIGMDAE